VRKIGRLLPLVVAATALVLTPTTHAFGHETGAIHLAANHIPVGGDIELRGEKLPKSEKLKLELRGILDTYPVGEVRTDTGGAFQGKFALPSGVPAATYTLVAIASDGDVTARADLTVVAGAAVSTAVSTTTPAAGSSSMPGMPGMSSEASAAPMQIPSTTTTAQWVVIYAIILLSLASGVFLLRRAAGATGPH
jgi:hypothetical protein